MLVYSAATRLSAMHVVMQMTQTHLDELKCFTQKFDSSATAIQRSRGAAMDDVVMSCTLHSEGEKQATVNATF